MKGFFHLSKNDDPMRGVRHHHKVPSAFAHGKVHKFKLLMVITILLSSAGVKALGLSGTYTIDPAGSGSTNYTTFALATADLSTNGITGPVVFNVAAATFTENVIVGTISGSSATNTITFQGKGRGSTFVKGGSGTAFYLNYSNYVILAGMNLTATGTSSGSPVVNCNYDNYTTIINCNIIATDLTSAAYYNLKANYSNHLTVNNNNISGSYWGVYFYTYGTTSGFLTFTNNRVTNFYYYGIYDYGSQGTAGNNVIANNVIDSTTSGYGYGLYSYYETNLVIKNNKILAKGLYYSMYVNYPNYYNSTGTVQIYNNFYYGWQYYGLYLYTYGSNVTVSHNTFYNSQGSTSTSYCCLYDYNYSGTNIKIISNIFYNNVSGNSAVYHAYTTGISQMDGNDYYSAGANLVYWNGTTYSTFAAYQAAVASYGFDQKSSNIKTTFANALPDLHISQTVAAAGGVYSAGVNTDIDGDARFKTPTAGADESYFGVKNDNAGVFAMTGPYNFCPGTATFAVDIANLGLNSISSVKIGWSVDGVGMSPVIYSSSIPLYGDAVVTLGTYLFASGVKHTLKAWTYLPNGTTDSKASDDTLVVSNIAPSLSGTFTINPGGSGSSNFTSFASAMSYLNTSGVCGPVIFKISPGTYNEAAVLNNVSGSSSTNTITFDGGDSSKTILSNIAAGSGQAAFTVNGCSYVTIKHLGIYTGSNSGAMALHLTNGASYNTVTGCIVQCDTTTTNTVTALAISGSSNTSSDPAHHNTILNNIVKGGYYTFTCYGVGSSTPNPGNQIIHNQITRGSNYVLYFLYQTGYTISKNTISARPGSSNTSYALYDMYSNSGVVDGNIISSNYQNYLYYADYYVQGGATYFTNNVLYGQYYSSSCYTLYAYYNVNTKMYHNIFYNTLPGAGYSLYAYGYSSNNFDIRDNIFYRSSNSVYNVYSASTAYVAKFDYNDFWGATGGNFVTIGSTYSDLPTMQKALIASPAIANNNSVFTDPGFTSTTYGSENFRMCKTCYGVSGTDVGVKFDADGKPRCQLFPNMGAYETNNGKGKPSVKFFITSNIFPGSPSYVYQTYKAGAPVASHWYLQNSTYGTLTKISDSTTLKTSKFTVGSNTLKLVVNTCGGNDSFTQTFNVVAPGSVPATDFVANKNAIVTNDIVNFQDLSTNGPQTWIWKISPDSTISGGSKVPTTKYVFGSFTYQNPQIQFLFPGKYQVCLTASNGVGKGATACKKDYITVLPTVNLSIAPLTVTSASGYLYDDGGPNAAYVNNGGAPSILIAPCADSVYLVFTMFDLNCNISFLQLYEGSNPKGKRLDPCGGSGLNSGLTGGPSGAACTSPCMPNLSKPDTFKAAKSMFIQMNDGSASANAKGFAAYWWSKPSSSKKPKASFTLSGGTGDSVCVNATVTFTNTTVNTNPTDPVTFLWDLDGDPTSFECIGTCATAFWPYFLTGPTTVTMIATNCGGSDTSKHTLIVYDPKSPKSGFKADNTSPTTADVVFFTATTPQCVEDYQWTITKSSGSGSGTATYVNNTSNIYANPQVTFSDTGYYDVTLYVDNLNASQKDVITIKNYIHVRNAYCVPSVATLNQGMGISGVTFNTINNSTTQAQQDYTNFLANQSLSTSVAQGATYPISVSRNPNFLFENLNRSVFIDWNQDGSFTGKGEEAAEDSNSNSVKWTGKITVPKSAKLGATVMRIAVNRGAYSNKPCGQNEFGEYQDYRIYVTPYNIIPVITLTGHQGLKDTIKIEQGHPFVEPGYSATSFLYGNMTPYVKVASRKLGSSLPGDSFNMVVPATYIFTYNVTDSTGNKAVTQFRVVVVTKDATAPTLIIDKPDTTLIEVTSGPTTPPAPKVISADDLVDGPLANSVTNDANKVTTNIIGLYTVTYTVTDLSGNTATVYRYIKVIDTLKPVITLLGTNPATVQVLTSYTDDGVKVSDNYDNGTTLNALLVVTSTVDITKIGTYLVTYNLSDASGNKAATVTRTVKVVDTIKPVVTLNGAQSDSVEVFDRYVDPGVTVSDNYNIQQDLTITVTGTFYAAFPAGSKAKTTGVYKIIYTVTDKSGNSASITRDVKVVDHVAPVFTLLGDATVTVCRWFNYTDAGYTVTDNYDAPKDIKVVTLSTGNTLSEGLFSIRYKGTDLSGNIGFSEYRYILVKEASSPGCVSAVEPGLSLDKYITVYPNPNNGIFNISANLPTQEKIRMSVTNVLGEEIAVINNGILSQNTYKVDLSNQPAGMYLLNIVSGTQTLTKRIEIVK
jgi:hypothetical protein